VFPEIVEWGPIHVRAYGLMLAVAFLVGTWLALREARRLALDGDRLVNVILVALVAGVLGARAMYVLEHVEQFRREWGSVIALWVGGHPRSVGVVGGAGVGLAVARHLRLPMWTVADAVTPSLALGMMFGRIGCFLNGCCYGHPTHLPWGVVFPPDSFAALEFGSAAVHPSQLYFSAAGLALFLLLWPLRTRIRTPGVLFWLFIGLFGVTRIPLDMTRAYEAEARLLSAGGVTITESMVISVTLALFAMLMILRLARRARRAP
jgi:phosphatidylglycerol:prolipoprotein diacylglycerol transferase